MGLFPKCAVLFCLGFIVDLLQTIHIQACANGKLAMSVGTIVAIYLIGFWGHDWFVKHKSSWDRWSLTLSGALGAGLGTGVVLLVGA